MAIGWKKFTGKSQYPELSSNNQGSAFTYGSKRDRNFRMGWIQGKRNGEMEKEILEWISFITAEFINSIEDLNDGKILCKLLSRINANILIRPINEKPPLFSATENVETFLETLRKCGFQDDELFSANLLVEQRDLNKVCDTLILLKDRSPQIQTM